MSITIHVTDNQADQHSLSAETGQSLMQVLSDNNLSGMVAACGGVCACATCQVYIDSDNSDAIKQAVGQASELEEVLLDMADEKRENSRLSCQVQLDTALNNIKVTIANNE